MYSAYEVLHNLIGLFGVSWWTLRLFLQARCNKHRGTVLEISGISRRIKGFVCYLCWVAWACAYLVLAITLITTASKDIEVSDTLSIMQPHASMLAFFVLAYQLLAYESATPRFVNWIICAFHVGMITVAEVMFIKMTKDLVGTSASEALFKVKLLLAAVGLMMGYCPLYMESIRHQGRGITLTTTTSIYGIIASFSSLIATIMQTHPSPLAIVLHTGTLVNEVALLISHLVWMFRTRQERAAARVQGLTFDELAAQHARNGLPYRFAASQKIAPPTAANSPSPDSPSRDVEAGRAGEADSWEWVELKQQPKADRSV
ncbi:hypothetical protein F4810DRAFT_28904 [Camillea tinctor]|nr:hypothetical protein F4810DRAFT_28904 [Camillea tinctor]